MKHMNKSWKTFADVMWTAAASVAVGRTIDDACCTEMLKQFSTVAACGMRRRNESAKEWKNQQTRPTLLQISSFKISRNFWSNCLQFINQTKSKRHAACAILTLVSTHWTSSDWKSPSQCQVGLVGVWKMQPTHEECRAHESRTSFKRCKAIKP